jgi:dUTP pyrophosphatase
LKQGIQRVPLGFSLAIPPGYEVQVRPRSGNTLDGVLVVFGTVDSDYTGELSALVHSDTARPFSGRLCQLVLARVERADWPVLMVPRRGGFGSTG